MVDADEPHVVDLRGRSDVRSAPATETTGPSRPGWGTALAIAGALAAVGVFTIFTASSDQPDVADATPTPAATPDQTTAEDTADGSRPGPPPGAVTATIAPVDVDAALVVAARPIDDGPLDFIRIDSATGAATFLDNRSLLGLDTIDDVRFFGPDRAVAQLADGTYLTLAIGEGRVDVANLVDVTASAAATPLGLEALSPDGRVAWVASPYGFFSWDLADDRIVARWLDRDGDLDRLPTARLAVEPGLIVEAGGETYLIETSTARRLPIDGAVVAGADDWVLTRSCDDSLDCGDLELVNLSSSVTVALRDERYRQQCGLMASVPNRDDPDDAVAVVLQRFGSTAAVVADGDGIVAVTPLLPLPVGCVDATVLDNGVIVVFSATTIAFVAGDVEVVTTYPLGRTIAGTASLPNA